MGDASSCNAGGCGGNSERSARCTMKKPPSTKRKTKPMGTVASADSVAPHRTNSHGVHRPASTNGEYDEIAERSSTHAVSDRGAGGRFVAGNRGAPSASCRSSPRGLPGVLLARRRKRSHLLTIFSCTVFPRVLDRISSRISRSSSSTASFLSASFGRLGGTHLTAARCSGALRPRV